MSDVQIRRGGAPTDSLILVNTDGTTIQGDGSLDFPLTAVAGEAGEAARMLYVATAWSGEVDPTVYFTTIADALAQAATMSPVSGNPVLIAIAPGTYVENPVLQSWVFLTALVDSFVGVTVSGTASWTPTGAVAEAINVYHINITGLFTINTTGKSAGQTSALFNTCEIAMAYTGRAASGATRDYIQFVACTPQMAGLAFTSALVEYLAGRLSALTFSGACQANIAGCTTIPTAGGAHSINGTSLVKITGTILLGLGVTLASGTSAIITGCEGTGAIAVAAGAAIDLRANNFGGDGNLAGPGTINRTTMNFSFGPTSAGANAVTFTIPLPDNSYNVQFGLTGGAGNAGAGVSSKLSTGFTFTDSAGGNTYNFTVIHD